MPVMESSGNEVWAIGTSGTRDCWMIYEALQRIERAGFTIQECNGLLAVEPAHQLSEVQRQWIELHQRDIIRQLQAKRNVDILAIMDEFQADVMSLN